MKGNLHFKNILLGATLNYWTQVLSRTMSLKKSVLKLLKQRCKLSSEWENPQDVHTVRARGKLLYFVESFFFFSYAAPWFHVRHIKSSKQIIWIPFVYFSWPNLTDPEGVLKTLQHVQISLQALIPAKKNMHSVCTQCAILLCPVPSQMFFLNEVSAF